MNVTKKGSFTTAVHEASHAVVCLATGGHVDRISLGDREIPHGYTRARYEKSRRGDLSKSLASLAGYAGQFWLESGGDAGFVRSALGHAVALQVEQDFVLHRQTLDELVRQQRGPVRYSKDRIGGDAIAQTVSLVNQCWPAIYEVAEALEHRGHLSGEVVRVLAEIAMESPRDSYP